MGSPTCYASKDIVRLRVALLSAAGAPDAGAENGYVSDAVVSVQRTPRTEAGEEFTQKSGSGAICQTDKDCDRIKGEDVVLRLCTNDLQLIGLITGATLFEDGTGTMGLVELGISDDCPQPFSFEWWSIAWDGAVQASISGTPLYWQRVIPFNTGIYAAQTYERGFLVVELSLTGSENPNITKNGPFDDWPSQLPPDGPTGPFAEWRTTTLPDADCDFIAVTSAAS